MSMTALVSAFARAYHTRREGAKIFDDKYARLLLSTEEHEQIGAHMASGVSFFDPAFRGDAGDALSGCIGSPSGRSDEGGVRQRHPGPYGAILRPAAGIIPDTTGYTGAVLRPLQRRSGGLPHVRAHRCGLLCANAGIRWKMQGKRPAFSILCTHSALTPSMMIPPASWAISSGVSFMPPESHCSVSVKLPDTMNRQKYSSRSRSPP